MDSNESTDNPMSRCLLQKAEAGKMVFIGPNGEETPDAKQARIYSDANEARISAIKLGVYQETQIVFCFQILRILR